MSAHRLPVPLSAHVYGIVGREAAVAGCSMSEFMREAALTRAVEARTSRALQSAPLPAVAKVLGPIDDHAQERGWTDVRAAVRQLHAALIEATRTGGTNG